jgi:hypothetical protein
VRSWGPIAIVACPAAVGTKPKATLLEPDGMVSEAHGHDPLAPASHAGGASGVVHAWSE